MTVTPLLKIDGLEASIDETVILKGIDLEILPGEVHAVMGRNGSGKSTTAHVLMGHPDYEVTITFDGEPIQCSNVEILSNTSIEYVYTNDNSDYDIVYNFDPDTEE